MIRHKSGYRVYARNDSTLPHKAVASWKSSDGEWYCACGYPIHGPSNYFGLQTHHGRGLLDFLNPVPYDREGMARIIRLVEQEAGGQILTTPKAPLRC